MNEQNDGNVIELIDLEPKSEVKGGIGRLDINDVFIFKDPNKQLGHVKVIDGTKLG